MREGGGQEGAVSRRQRAVQANLRVQAARVVQRSAPQLQAEVGEGRVGLEGGGVEQRRLANIQLRLARVASSGGTVRELWRRKKMHWRASLKRIGPVGSP